MSEESKPIAASAASESEPLADDEGYPTGAAIARIRAWPVANVRELLPFVRECWWMPDRGWSETVEEGRILYAISTGGWSGNEDLIEALHANTMFWMLYWRLSRRGGHYEFKSILATDAAEPPHDSEIERLRASFTTAEKALRTLVESPTGQNALRYLDSGIGTSTWERMWFDARAALSRRNATDAPKAPKASDIASDSSALEKALGALRAAREWVKQAGYSARGARNLLIEIDAILSGGAHVDVPKAQPGPGDRAEKEGEG